MREAYLALDADGMSGWIDRSLHDALPPALREKPWEMAVIPGAVVIRDKRNLTLRLDAALPAPFDTLWIKSYARSGLSPPSRKAVKTWNAALALRAHAIATPRPLMALSRGSKVALTVTEHVTDSQPLAALVRRGAHPVPDPAAAMHELGGMLRRFHDHGFQHRDLTTANLLVHRHGERLSFVLIDINRLRRYAPLNRSQRLRDLERLHLPGGMLLEMCRGYRDAPGEAERLAQAILSRQRHRDALGRLPRPLGRVAVKLWYYLRELGTWRKQRDVLEGTDLHTCAQATHQSPHRP